MKINKKPVTFHHNHQSEPVTFDPDTISSKQTHTLPQEVWPDGASHTLSLLWLLLALTSDRKGDKQTRCHGNPKPLHDGVCVCVCGLDTG